MHPQAKIAWTSLAADEPDRFVVGVFHGDTRPPRYVFFAVSKSSGDAPYRPKVWR